MKIFSKNKNTSSILDIGCGTGHHVNLFLEKKIAPRVIGVDISPAMIQKARATYPSLSKDVFRVGDIQHAALFPLHSFTQIVCFYFTVYYLEDKALFFQNCMDWLKPGGSLTIHLVDRRTFDPILPPGNPLLIISPQRYAKERITRTKIHFDQFEYQSNFQSDEASVRSSFHEKFVFPNGKIRKQEHVFYMESMDDIVNIALDVGFILHAQIHLIKVAYDNQFLFVFLKP